MNQPPAFLFSVLHQDSHPISPFVAEILETIVNWSPTPKLGVITPVGVGAGTVVHPPPINTSYALLPKGLQRIDAVALGGPSAATGEGPPPLPESEVALPEPLGWAGAAGEAGVVEGAEAESGVDGGEAGVATGS